MRRLLSRVAVAPPHICWKSDVAMSTTLITGAAVPPTAGAVIPQENVTVEGEELTTNAAVTSGDHIRDAGEDMAAGTVVLTGGTLLGAVELGAAVAAGVGEVTVAQRPRVSVL